MDGENSLIVEAIQYSDDEFLAYAPLGNQPVLTQEQIDCEVCCPGSCTGCTKCNKCNLLF